MKKYCDITVKTKTQERTYKLRTGLGLQALRAEDDSALEFSCREADCGICVFSVLAGEDNLSLKTERESDFLKAMRADSNERLACQCRVFGDLIISLD